MAKQIVGYRVAVFLRNPWPNQGERPTPPPIDSIWWFRLVADSAYGWTLPHPKRELGFGYRRAHRGTVYESRAAALAEAARWRVGYWVRLIRVVRHAGR